MRRPRLPRLSFAARFGLTSLFVIAALGGILAAYLRNQVENEALREATRVAELSAQLSIEPLLTKDDLDGGMSRRRLAEVARALDVKRLRGEIVRVKIWNDQAQ